MKGQCKWLQKRKARKEKKKDILSNGLTKNQGLQHIFPIICASLFVSVGRILIEMCVCVSFILSTSVCILCVYVQVCLFRFLCCAWVCVRDNLPLTYVPSFVSEDYSFPFEVRLLAQRGRSERRPRAGFHTFPTAACRLGGKYVCRPQRQRERARERQEK